MQYTVDGYKKSLVEWIVARDKPFREVEDPFFRKMIHSLRADARTYCANTIRNQIMTMSDEMHHTLVNELQVSTNIIDHNQTASQFFNAHYGKIIIYTI